jgi:S1-C subfamily serine protease
MIVRPIRPGRPSRSDGWRLDVLATESDTGMLVTQVVPGGAGARAGLERGDRIVAVGVDRVGFVGRQTPSFRDALQRNANARGKVLLLVQNRRNGNLVNRNVSLSGGEAVGRPFAGGW